MFFIENFDSVVSSDSGVFATPFPPMNPFRMYFWYIFVCVFSGVFFFFFFFFFFLQHFFSVFFGLSSTVIWLVPGKAMLHNDFQIIG